MVAFFFESRKAESNDLSRNACDAARIVEGVASRLGGPSPHHTAGIALDIPRKQFRSRVKASI